MNRIDFFKQLFLGFTGLLLYRKAHAAKNIREIRLCSPFIAGFQYYDGLKAGHFLCENDPLLLKREPTNPHDCYAIEVFQGEAKLGYLPRKENKVVARMMDQGVQVKARITNIDHEVPYYNKIKMKIFYEI